MTQYKEDVCFCTNVRNLRKMYNLTKEQMSKVMGIGIHSLNLIEKGIIPQKLSINAVFALARYFRIPPKNIFTEITYEK